MFSRKVWPSTKFHDFHVWGCPVYVLDSKLSNGSKRPRWTPRLSRGMYVGISKKHGHSVPLVLDLETGKITAQYHVVFDDWFHTVEATNEEKIDFDHDDWYKTFGLADLVPPELYVPVSGSLGKHIRPVLPDALQRLTSRSFTWSGLHIQLTAR